MGFLTRINILLLRVIIAFLSVVYFIVRGDNLIYLLLQSFYSSLFPVYVSSALHSRHSLFTILASHVNLSPLLCLYHFCLPSLGRQSPCIFSFSMILFFNLFGAFCCSGVYFFPFFMLFLLGRYLSFPAQPTQSICCLDSSLLDILSTILLLL